MVLDKLGPPIFVKELLKPLTIFSGFVKSLPFTVIVFIKFSLALTLQHYKLPDSFQDRESTQRSRSFNLCSTELFQFDTFPFC